jgi:glutaredoxin-like YruB-family protein
VKRTNRTRAAARLAALAALALLAAAAGCGASEAPASGGGVYWQYVDESGSVRFARSLEEVPAAWRDRAGRVELDAPPTGAGSAGTAAQAEPAVVVYTTSWCGWCRKTLAWLDEQGVAYVNKDIEADDRHREELMRKTGRTSIPVVEIGGELVKGYDPARMRALLGS